MWFQPFAIEPWYVALSRALQRLDAVLKVHDSRSGEERSEMKLYFCARKELLTAGQEVVSVKTDHKDGLQIKHMHYWKQKCKLWNTVFYCRMKLSGLSAQNSNLTDETGHVGFKFLHPLGSILFSGDAIQFIIGPGVLWAHSRTLVLLANFWIPSCFTYWGDTCKPFIYLSIVVYPLTPLTCPHAHLSPWHPSHLLYTPWYSQ